MLILVRHGQTTANADHLISGQADVPLTDLGRGQAEAVARALPEPARVISSPLERARQTAAAFGRSVEVDERWMELDYGDLEGRPVSSVGEDVWAEWRADLSYIAHGGESLADLARRVRAACGDLAADAAERDVVVVTHVSPIKAAVAWALGVGDDIAWRLYVADCSVCRIGIGPTGPFLAAFNQQYGPGPAPR